MTRKEFLNTVGVSSAALTIITCQACKKDSSSAGSVVAGPTGIDFTLDLTSSTNAALKTNGGFVAANGVIVARATAVTYIAVQQSCTHETYNLVYQGANNLFYCASHGSEFSNSGAVIQGPAARNLTVYNTTLTSNSLRVYS